MGNHGDQQCFRGCFAAAKLIEECRRFRSVFEGWVNYNAIDSFMRGSLVWGSFHGGSPGSLQRRRRGHISVGTQQCRSGPVRVLQPEWRRSLGFVERSRSVVGGGGFQQPGCAECADNGQLADIDIGVDRSAVRIAKAAAKLDSRRTPRAALRASSCGRCACRRRRGRIWRCDNSFCLARGWRARYSAQPAFFDAGAAGRLLFDDFQERDERPSEQSADWCGFRVPLVVSRVIRGEVAFRTPKLLDA